MYMPPPPRPGGPPSIPGPGVPPPGSGPGPGPLALYPSERERDRERERVERERDRERFIPDRERDRDRERERDRERDRRSLNPSPHPGSTIYPDPASYLGPGPPHGHRTSRSYSTSSQPPPGRNSASPAMGSLQRPPIGPPPHHHPSLPPPTLAPPYPPIDRDRERERDRRTSDDFLDRAGPRSAGPSHLGNSGFPGPSTSLGAPHLSVSGSNTSSSTPSTMNAPPHAHGNPYPVSRGRERERDRDRERDLLTGPGMGAGLGLGGGDRERERDLVRSERDREWERERERERERDVRERERMYQEERARERDREHEREREFMMNHPPSAPPSTSSANPVWSRFAAPRTSSSSTPAPPPPPPPGPGFMLGALGGMAMSGMPDKEEHERMLMNQLNLDKNYDAKYREKVAEDLQREEERQLAFAAKHGISLGPSRSRRTSLKDREREQEREMREMREIREIRDREQREPPLPPTRKSQRDEHGWMPEPRSLAEPPSLERERDRRDREREREEMEMARRQVAPGGGQYHVHHHHVHHVHNPPPSSSGMPRPSKSLKEGAGGLPGGMQPPSYGIVPPPGMDRRESLGAQKQGMGPSTPTGNGPMIQGHPPREVPPQPHTHRIHHHHPQPHSHQHPLAHQHLHQHTHAHPHGLANAGPMPFPHRRSPPPPSSFQIPPGPQSFHHPHSPPPPPHPMIPSLPPLHLGTFVYPQLPFPFTDFPDPPYVSEMPGPVPNAALTLSAKEPEPREIHLTILIPCGFLTTEPPRQPRLWGGAEIPSFNPLFASPQLLSHLQSGMPYHHSRRGPHPYEVVGRRRVYTDDSDLICTSVHCGKVNWMMIQRAKQSGKDMKVEARLTREARFVGGYGAECVSAKRKGKARGESDWEDGEDGNEFGDGRDLLSAGWGNGHDGAGVEILNIEFVEPGAAHSLSIPNRSQRLLEYSERRLALSCSSGSVTRRKRRRVGSYSGDESCSLLQRRMNAEDAELCASRTLVFGQRPGWSDISYEYHPSGLKAALFPLSGDESETDSRARKRRRLSAESSQKQVEVDTKDGSRTSSGRSVLLQTSCEIFVLQPQTKLPVGEQNKENIEDEVQKPHPRYSISLVTREPSSPDQAPNDSADSVPATEPSKTSDVPMLGSDVDTRPPKAPVKPTDSSQAVPSIESTTTPSTEGTKPDLGAHVNGNHVISNTDAPMSDAVPSTGNSDASLHPTASLAEGGDSVGATSNSYKTEAKVPTSGAKTEPTSAPTVNAFTPLLSSAKARDRQLPQKTVLQVLQQDLTEDNFIFAEDGVSILSSDEENGIRKGFKLEVRTWRWADDRMLEARSR
ncbi:unnamed protein product [Somion occarium]